MVSLSPPTKNGNKKEEEPGPSQIWKTPPLAVRRVTQPWFRTPHSSLKRTMWRKQRKGLAWEAERSWQEKYGPVSLDMVASCSHLEGISAAVVDELVVLVPSVPLQSQRKTYIASVSTNLGGTTTTSERSG